MEGNIIEINVANGISIAVMIVVLLLLGALARKLIGRNRKPQAVSGASTMANIAAMGV